MEYRIRQCNEKQLPEILEILNDTILHSTALYDYKPRTMDNMQTWYAAKLRGNYPVIGVIDPDEKLLGFTSEISFRKDLLFEVFGDAFLLLRIWHLKKPV
jgi:L-amino acid N-acyltransferase YncA